MDSPIPEDECNRLVQLADYDLDNDEMPFPKAKLLQILGNLISNAIKFTPAGGQVVVNLNLIERSQYRKLVVKVTDTGAGMTERQIEDIMKGEGNTTAGSAGEKGYGFGLPLVKHLIDGMRGSLKIDSKIGEYASFEVSLPV
ncbi:sensor histidine kinase [Cyclobacterium sp. SYSU L10401]|uniref:sensor histidine kinase n=1 Tax=Cyclobacterium sp. SYSU L10401 TaxID=2678657 RepID=UPI0013D6CB73|nr:ATP-binding protein [Cyclobacterium sp. SYSU L10401]